MKLIVLLAALGITAWMIIAGLVAKIAREKGRRASLWFAFGLVMPIVAIIAVVLSSPFEIEPGPMYDRAFKP